MPVPSVITDLSQTAASNYPQGSDSPSTLDDVQRAHGSFIAQLRDGKGFTNPVVLASAATTDIGGQNSQFVEISGTTTITSFGTTYNGPRYLRFQSALTLTYNATTLILPGAASITTVAGDTCIAVPNQALNGWTVVSYQRASGSALVAPATPAQIQPISASVGSNALTITSSALALDFRSTTLGSGAVTTVSGTPSSLVVPASATLGTVNATQSRLVVLALNNAGTIELAVVNIAGGNDLTETGVISTTAISAAATSASTIYSTSARTNVAYRVIGYIESTQATAGTWATSPSTIQGYGGQALSAMSSLGYGQTWQNVVGSRAFATTYYNTTGKPIVLVIVPGGSGTSINISASINGASAFLFAQCALPSGVATCVGTIAIPAGASYNITQSGGSGTPSTWYELR